MRFLEDHSVYGLILVSACHTDLGMASERISNYYPGDDGSNPWKWDEIKKHAKWIVQFHSTDDGFIPIEEARVVAEKLGSEYFEQDDRGHYLEQTFPDLLELIRKKSAEYQKEQGKSNTDS